MSKGVDYSWARPGGAALKQKGYTYACRYLSHDPGKTLDAADANDLRSNGLEIVVVWESTATRALSGKDAGVSDANDAVNELKALGAPSNLPIYFAVDFDEADTDAQNNAVYDYFRGVNSVIGVGRTGIYGGYYPLKRVKAQGLATYLWQTLAWSGGQVLDGIHIYQNGQTDFSGGCDVDESKQDGFGQWTTDGAPSPAPAPAPTPAPAPAPAPTSQGGTYTVVSGDTLSGIAAKYGTTYQVLAQINGIQNPNVIQVGEQIRLPGGAPTPQPNGLVYTVKSGDTLSAIGAHFNVDYHLIASLNNISDPNKINIGQVLRIPGGGAPAPTQNILYYTVQPGDTLGGIAGRYNTTYQHLAQVNGIADPNLIFAGQVIKIT